MNTIIALVGTMPGADCRGVGIRASALFRKIMDISFDDPDDEVF